MNTFFYYLKIGASSLLLLFFPLIIISKTSFGTNMSVSDWGIVSILCLIPIVFIVYALLKHTYTDSQQIAIEDVEQHKINVWVAWIKLGSLVPLYLTFAIPAWIEEQVRALGQGGLEIVGMYFIYLLPVTFFGLLSVMKFKTLYQSTRSVRYRFFSIVSLLLLIGILILMYVYLKP